MLIAVYVALMVIGLVGLIVCQKKQKTNPNAQTIALLFLVPTLIGAGGLIYDQFAGGDREMEQIMKNEIAFAQARAQKVAEFAGQNWAGQSAVIIVEPNTDKNRIAKAGLDALKESLKKAGISATEVALNIPQGSDGEPVPLETAINAKIYNEVFSKNKSANIFFILSQLPMDPQELMKMDCWKFEPKKSRVVMISAEIYNLKNLIAKGIIGAAIGSQNNYDPEKPAPKDWKAAFDARYILITPQNLKEVIAKRSDLFAK